MATTPAEKQSPKEKTGEKEKKVTKLKIKGIKEPVTVTRTRDTGKAIHRYFEHPDTGKESRVITLK